MLTFTVNAQENFKIGIDDEGKFIITENIDVIIKDWTNFINENKIDVILTTFEIRQTKYKDKEGGSYYYLLGNDKEKTVKVAKLLLYDNVSDVFYFNNKMFMNYAATKSLDKFIINFDNNEFDIVSDSFCLNIKFSC